MTGGGRGICNTGRLAYERGAAGGAGFGRGMGLGRGFRGGQGPAMRGYPGRELGQNRRVSMEAYPEDAQVEIDRLKVQAESMKRTLDAVHQRLSEMETRE